jgi:cytochrome c553
MRHKETIMERYTVFPVLSEADVAMLCQALAQLTTETPEDEARRLELGEHLADLLERR